MTGKINNDGRGENKDKRLDEQLYPKHFEAMEHAGLLEDVEIPMLKGKREEIYRSMEEVESELDKVKKKRKRNNRNSKILMIAQG